MREEPSKTCDSDAGDGGSTLRNFFFTTLTVSTNALVSLCDDTAEQRQLLSESKRYGDLIYRCFKNSRTLTDFCTIPGSVGFNARIFPYDIVCRQISTRHVQIFNSNEQYSFEIYINRRLIFYNMISYNFCQNTIFLMAILIKCLWLFVA